jgi:hypothetical protein
MSTQIIIVKNLGGRPPKITDGVVWEMIRIKSQYGIGEWKKTIYLFRELHPDWALPNYKNCLAGIYRTFDMLVNTINFVLFMNRLEFLKKTVNQEVR